MYRPKPPLKILVVDDLDENLQVMHAVLQKPGVELLLARSGAEALELLLEHDVALALLDVQMPGMDGFELAELIRGTERTRSIPLIFVTAGLHDQMRLFKGYELGAVDFLFKPVEPAILRQKVGVFLELSRQREQLRDALRLNETFVAVLAHDLRTPLSSIAMAIEIFRGSHDVQAAAVAERLHSSTTRMSGLIEQLCDLSRVRLGAGFNLTLRDVDLAAVVQRCVAELEPAAGARFDVRAPSELALVGDEGRLAQVVSNILGNAVRHGDPERPIEVRTRRGETTATIEIKNGGVIPPELRGELFLPFKSHTKRTGKREGLGLGLYIVDQIVRAHAGNIDVVSGEGETTVRITLPLKGPEENPAALDRSPAR